MKKDTMVLYVIVTHSITKLSTIERYDVDKEEADFLLREYPNGYFKSFKEAKEMILFNCKQLVEKHTANLKYNKSLSKKEVDKQFIK